MTEFKDQSHNILQAHERRSSEASVHSESLFIEYQKSLAPPNAGRPGLDGSRQMTPASDGSHGSILPVVELSAPVLCDRKQHQTGTEGAGSIHDIVIKGRNGHSDTVSAIKPETGESLAQLIKRLHPSLTAEQLAHQVKQVLKYNRDYGNELGDGSHLDSSRAVFLTSVKYLDAQGRVSRVEGPTGRLTELSYGADGSISAYKISGPGGALEEEAGKNASGQWLLSRHGQTVTLTKVDIDTSGDLIATDSQGNQSAHLSNGTDLSTNYDGKRALKSVATRQGEEIAEYQYEYDGAATKVFVIDKANPSQRILLNGQESPDIFARLALARGLFAHKETPLVNRSGFDLPTDNFVASTIVRAGMSLLGQPVTNFDSSIPTRVGCARMVSQALVCAGFDGQIIDANVDNLEAKLKSRGFVPVAEADLQAGDIIIATGPGPKDGHTGIYAGNGMTLNNSSSCGVFSSSSYSGTFAGFSRRVGYRYLA